MKYHVTTEPQRRAYHQTARAKASAKTGKRILDAAFARFATMLFEEVTLRAIAADADVSEQTVIRRFGSKEELFAAVGERERARILAEREPDDDGDQPLESSIHALVGHYESDGPVMLNFLAQESRSPLIAKVLREGRTTHEGWVERHCATVLGQTQGAERERRVAAAIAATDLYTWKLLRLDRGLEPPEVEGVMVALLRGLERTAGGT